MKNNKIIFDDDDKTGGLTDEILQIKPKLFHGSGPKIGHKNVENADVETEKRWFDVYNQFSNCEEIPDIKDSGQMELYNICKSSFEAMKSVFQKRNPSDVRWLQTALHKGTAKDRANAGALLVTSNPVGNLEALSVLNSYTKLSNKCSTEICTILTDLWKEVLLPPHRKLISIQMRGDHWKMVRKESSLNNHERQMIYAYWFFENEVKDYYFEFLKNIQENIQKGQENNKTNSIVCLSQLLTYAPEKEKMLLTMMINKLGDPNSKVASKALYHLSEVAYKHPNMCYVIVTETEKLLFRNNISDRTQHFSLCFLGSISACGQKNVCSKLVNICFSFFKILVQKGSINNRIMQAILRCLQKSVAGLNTAEDEFLSKDMQDTIYRLVHLADIHVAVQTLGLLLQLIIVKTGKADRFYNALYKKMLDVEITSIGTKIGAHFLHILHRAIHLDSNIERAKAFIKRLLQLSLYMPSHLSAGCLIILNKILCSRKELSHALTADANKLMKIENFENDLTKFDCEGEETYQDVPDNESAESDTIGGNLNTNTLTASWHHANICNDEHDKKAYQASSYNYDPYNRVPSNACAEFSVRYEFHLLRTHYHPTIKVIAEKLLNQQKLDYYGDPLRDFGLPHFLERFAFKNPKKPNSNQTTTQKKYVAFGTRGKPVTTLTKQNCTEDEKYIFNYLEQKRTHVSTEKAEVNDKVDPEYTLGTEVDDDEFDEYLNGFFGKNIDANDDNDLNYLEELGGEVKDTKPKKPKRKPATSTEIDDIDWDDEDEQITNNEVISENNSSDEFDFNSGSLSSEESSDNGSDNESSVTHENISKSKKIKLKRSVDPSDIRTFNKRIKQSDVSSLFAAADDFSELLEEAAKVKGQGTINAVLNKDKSSEKQITWEEQRRSKTKNLKKRRNSKTQIGFPKKTKK